MCSSRLDHHTCAQGSPRTPDGTQAVFSEHCHFHVSHDDNGLTVSGRCPAYGTDSWESNPPHTVLETVSPPWNICPYIPQRAGRVPSISGGEKIPHGEGRAVLRGPAETSKGRGEGCKEAAQARAQALRRLSVGRAHRVQRFRSLAFFAISAAVLRLWQLWHRLWRLPGSVNTAQSPLWSRMWSTSVALVLMPCLAHSRHHGSRKS